MPRPKPREDEYFLCRCCGAKLPLAATFCRHCGASDECGWGEDHQQEELDLPRGYREDDNSDDDNFGDDDFDYDEFIASEFPDQAVGGDSPIQVRFRVVVVMLICIGLLASAMFYVFQ